MVNFFFYLNIWADYSTREVRMDSSYPFQRTRTRNGLQLRNKNENLYLERRCPKYLHITLIRSSVSVIRCQWKSWTISYEELHLYFYFLSFCLTLPWKYHFLKSLYITFYVQLQKFLTSSKKSNFIEIEEVNGQL